MESKIILSICIPTFNRAEYLESTILSIVKQTKFQETNEVEIIISDNCSTDNTKEISEKYTKMYGNKIRYFRNEKNIKDANFEKVLSHGKGIFLKLNNDTLMHRDNSLITIIDEINQNMENKEIIFFSCGSIKNITKCYCQDLDSFIKTVSFNSTWIACFGIWKEDFDSISNFSRISDLQLVQTDVLFRLIISNKSVSINNSNIFDSIIPKDKELYNFYKIFVTNYIGILERYSVTKEISKVTLFNEKTKLFLYWIIPSVFTLSRYKKPYPFTTKEIIRIVYNKYAFHPIFYIGIVYIYLKLGQNCFKKEITN